MILQYVFLLSIIISIAYLYLIIYIIRYWDQSFYPEAPSNYTPNKRITVVVCARNEEENISACIKSIKNCHYPSNLVDIILVDDHSEDDTIHIANTYEGVKILQLKDYLKGEKTKQFKKKAIQYAVDNSNTSIVAMTDADCIVSPEWLRHLTYYFEEDDVHFIGGSVLIKPYKTRLARFEALDQVGMMGVTAAGICSESWYMANGANLAFRKDSFNQLDPYTKPVASGDDIFLVEAFAKNKMGILFLNNRKHLVSTKSTAGLSHFVQQRIRWSTKNKNTKQLKYALSMIIPFAMVNFIIVNLILSFFDPLAAVILFTLLFVKLTIDYIFLEKLCRHFDRLHFLKGYIISSLFHISYIFLIGWSSLFIRKYKWKGRKMV